MVICAIIGLTKIAELVSYSITIQPHVLHELDTESLLVYLISVHEANIQSGISWRPPLTCVP